MHHVQATSGVYNLFLKRNSFPSPLVNYFYPSFPQGKTFIKLRGGRGGGGGYGSGTGTYTVTCKIFSFSTLKYVLGVTEIEKIDSSKGPSTKLLTTGTGNQYQCLTFLNGRV
jgi:hypothetical protein